MQRVKIELKYTFRCTAKDLFVALTQPDYLQNWMTDRVEFDRKTGFYSFWWGESMERARIVEQLNNRFLKWKWEGDSHAEGEYVTFRISIVPDDEYIDLYVVDYCDANEERILRDSWDEQMSALDTLL